MTNGVMYDIINVEHCRAARRFSFRSRKGVIDMTISEVIALLTLIIMIIGVIEKKK